MLSRTQRAELRRVFGAEGSRMLKLLDALDEKDVLIAEFVDLSNEMLEAVDWDEVASSDAWRALEQKLEQLKARAEK